MNVRGCSMGDCYNDDEEKISFAMSEPNTLTVIELKEKLKMRGLSRQEQRRSSLRLWRLTQQIRGSRKKTSVAEAAIMLALKLRREKTHCDERWNSINAKRSSQSVSLNSLGVRSRCCAGSSDGIPSTRRRNRRRSALMLEERWFRACNRE